jgi:5-methylcytosine-specific restriction protein A
MKKWVAAKQEWRCGECKLLLEAAYEVDHIVPLAAGGSNEESNLRALCRRCHGLKTFRERL